MTSLRATASAQRSCPHGDASRNLLESQDSLLEAVGDCTCAPPPVDGLDGRVVRCMDCSAATATVRHEAASMMLIGCMRSVCRWCNAIYNQPWRYGAVPDQLLFLLRVCHSESETLQPPAPSLTVLYIG